MIALHHKHTRASEKRGFTLIELLVVTAIIAMLASIVMASLNNARKKSRDARRIADIRQLQTALELYNNNNHRYPVATTQTDAVTALDPITAAGGGGEIAAIPDDPFSGSYHYVYKSNVNGTYYCLGSVFENPPAPNSSCDTSATGLGSALVGIQYSAGP